MQVGGLASIFQVCIVHFQVFWGPSKFGLKGYPPPWGEICHLFFYCLLFFISGHGETQGLKYAKHGQYRQASCHNACDIPQTRVLVYSPIVQPEMSTPYYPLFKHI